MSQTTTLDRLGVGSDTARYGHRVSFLRPDRQPAAKPLTVLESRAGYQALHHRLAHVFPELANLTDDRSCSWVLHRLDKYPTAQRIGQARLPTLQKIPYLAPELAEPLHLLAPPSVAGLDGDVTETLRHDLVAQVRHTPHAEKQLRRLLSDAAAARPASPHLQVVTVPGSGVATAAVLIAPAIDSNRFATPTHVVGYVGVFPEENTSGVDKFGNPLPPGSMHMSRKGNDRGHAYLGNAARAALVHNPALGGLDRRLTAATVAPPPPPVKASLPNRPARPKVDFAFLGQQVSMAQVLRHLGLFDQLRGRGLQRCGPCPIHAQPNDPPPTFSAHRGKHIFQCFHAAGGAQGNVLGLWAAVHQLPLYEAALHWAETFHLPRNREAEPVRGTACARRPPCRSMEPVTESLLESLPR